MNHPRLVRCPWPRRPAPKHPLAEKTLFLPPHPNMGAKSMSRVVSQTFGRRIRPASLALSMTSGTDGETGVYTGRPWLRSAGLMTSTISKTCSARGGRIMFKQ